MNALISTTTLARLTDRTPAAIRLAVARRGHWCGIRPRKLPNGRLLWPREQVEQLLTAPQTEDNHASI